MYDFINVYDHIMMYSIGIVKLLPYSMIQCICLVELVVMKIAPQPTMTISLHSTVRISLFVAQLAPMTFAAAMLSFD